MLSKYLREFMYGGTDGIVTTFAVVAGFSGARLSLADPSTAFVIVLLFGFANLCADSVSMGLGDFLSVQANKDLFEAKKAQKLLSIEKDLHKEKKDTIALLEKKGVAKEDSEALTKIFSKNKSYWADFLLQEAGLPDPEGDNPYLTTLATVAAFVSFGAIPLLPYVFISASPPQVFILSLASTFAALILLGVLRWHVTGKSIQRAVGETLILGITASAIAYYVASIIAS